MLNCNVEKCFYLQNLENQIVADKVTVLYHPDDGEISLAPIRLIMRSTEVTQNGPHASVLLFHLSNSTFPSWKLNATKSLPATSFLV